MRRCCGHGAEGLLAEGCGLVRLQWKPHPHPHLPTHSAYSDTTTSTLASTLHSRHTAMYADGVAGSAPLRTEEPGSAASSQRCSRAGHAVCVGSLDP
eukprot:139639-Chlamydomonas_euryale.AAC.2